MGSEGSFAFRALLGDSMNAKMKPGVAVALVVAAVAVLGLIITRVIGSSQQQYGAAIPDVAMKEFKEKGPRPMGPIPMPGGGAGTLQGGAVGPPPGAAGAPKTK
jgi:hypothetical protein